MMDINFSPFPNLSTGRLELRQMTKQDAPDMLVMRADPEIMRYIYRPVMSRVEEAAKLIDIINENVANNQSINWGIYLKDKKQLLGFIGFVRIAKEHYRGEIGYLLHREYHGTGIMQEAAEAVIDYGFKGLGFHSMEGVVSPENIASIKLLERNRFVREAFYKEKEFYNGGFIDVSVYSRVVDQ